MDARRCASDVLGLGERRFTERGVGHATPVGLAHHEAHVAHLTLLVLLFDVGPAHLKHMVSACQQIARTRKHAEVKLRVTKRDCAKAGQ